LSSEAEKDMSDGADATPGPLERRGRAGDPQGDAPDRPTPADAPTGSHTDGITVADLIAKLSADGTPPAADSAEAQRPEPESPTTVLPAVADERPNADQPPNADEHSDRQDTEILPVVRDYDAELPDLAALSRRPPVRIGDTTATADRPRRRGRRGAMIAGRAVAALVAVFALVLTGGAWQWQSSKNHMLNTVAALDPDSRDIVDPNAQFGDENFLIVGVDSRIGDNADMGAGGTDDAAGARSDTVMLVNIPASRERVVAVSFPRDLAIKPMKCEPWNAETGEYGPIYDEKTGSYGPDEVYTETKLNSAYAFGGPKCLVKVIQKLSGLSINRFMAVDFAGFAKMVDALGGVEVCSTTPLKDYELGTVLANAGRQKLDGHTALNYVRARQVTTEFNGDYGRIKRQQLFLSSLLRSLISKEVFFSLSKLNNVVNMFINDSYVDNIKTKDLVDLGQSLQGVAAGRITFLTVPTVGYADEWGNETPRTDDMRAMFDAIINDDPLPGEKNADNTPVPGAPPSPTKTSSQTSTTRTTETPKPTPTPAPAAPEAAELVNAVTTDPKDVTVQVSNSTGQSGLAATAATELENHGFNVTTPDDYPSKVTSTTVMFSPGNEQAAATVASTLANPTIERVNGMGDVVQVVLGSDFRAVTPPEPSGSAVQVQVVRGTGSTAQLPEDLTVTNAADTTCE
jgi:LCP family protein required for cell wall assembly